MRTSPVSDRLSSMPISSVRKLLPYDIEARKQGAKVYHLNIGDPDIKTPDAMIDVLHNWKQNPIGYAPSVGTEDFMSALLWYYHELGFSFLQKQHILTTVGGSEALGMAMFATCNPGDEILVFEPFYSNYAAIANIYGVKFVAVETSIENGFHLPAKEKILAKISKKTKAILFSNPCNPTGTVYTKKEMDMLVEVAKETGIFLISDEVYREYIFVDYPHTSLCAYMEEIPEQAIVLDSLSKRYSLCGGRLGMVVSLNEKLMTGLLRWAMSRLSGGLVDQAIGAALTKVPPAYIKEVQAEYQKRRDVLYKGLKEISGVTVGIPEGAFYLMVGLPVKSSEDFCIWLLQTYRSKNETVMFAPGAGFYLTPGKGQNEVRIAYVLNTKDLSRAIQILKEGLSQYPEK